MSLSEEQLLEVAKLIAAKNREIADKIRKAAKRYEHTMADGSGHLDPEGATLHEIADAIDQV